jgi:PAS domain-containing protein
MVDLPGDSRTVASRHPEAGNKGRVGVMSHKEVELILTRQLASYLTLPIFIVDASGTLVFYNEPAEKILGIRFEETGEMPASDWVSAWLPTDEHGSPLPAESLPLMVALAERRLACGQFWVRGTDSVRRFLETVAFPLTGQGGHNLGAVVIFQEVSRP